MELVHPGVLKCTVTESTLLCGSVVLFTQFFSREVNKLDEKITSAHYKITIKPRKTFADIFC